MSKLIQIRLFAAVAIILSLSGSAVFLFSQVSEAVAQPVSLSTVQQPYPKGDRIPFPAKGAACSSQGWPHYEQECLFDHRSDGRKMVRVIAMH
jgi:hypothetical protein